MRGTQLCCWTQRSTDPSWRVLTEHASFAQPQVQPFAERTVLLRRSAIREILKVTEDPDIISFAGGLPNPATFPVAELNECGQRVLSEDGASSLQYASTEGYLPLREWISERYRFTHQVHVSPQEILITNGSQQGLDLLGRIFLNPGDRVLLERPAYLGAIQALCAYQARFSSVGLEPDGPNLEELRAALDELPDPSHPVLFYTVPNFQNPSGLSYSEEKRREVAALLSRHPTVVVEDDPYGELRFRGDAPPPLRRFLPGTVLLGSFSKVVAPGLRMGWICAPPPIMEMLVRAKQAADLHSSGYVQRVLYRFLSDFDFEARLAGLRTAYREQCDAMMAAAARHLPSETAITEPDGGMFLWVQLPAAVSASALFQRALAEKVAVVPGDAFFVDLADDVHLRLNFSNSSVEQIEEGMRRLGRAIRSG